MTSPRLPRDNLLANVATQARGCALGGSPFYAALFERAAADIRAGGVWWRLLEPFAHEEFETCRPLRIAGALHRRVLAGIDPPLAAVWGRDIDVAWPIVLSTIESNPAYLDEALARPVQTNEVGRSVALVGGLLLLAERHRQPIALREIGSSGGLNLRPDCYWYEQCGAGWGDAASRVRFVDQFNGGSPPFGAPLELVDRVGCDLFPVDVTTREGRDTLLSFVWPGQDERFAALADAIDAARGIGVPIVRADAIDFVRDSVAPAPRALTVLWHSIVWWYLSATQRAELVVAISRVGERARSDAPFAWLRFEPPIGAATPVELRATMWPGGNEQLLAHGGFHRNPVKWLV